MHANAANSIQIIAAGFTNVMLSVVFVIDKYRIRDNTAANKGGDNRTDGSTCARDETIIPYT